ncbi:MAG TPA: hypothetical protein VK745_00180 [Polyangiaceae bacterium]|jgi:hypothetical protein|nr:hypothetical protein [Polyangiaceae bacterium]
MRRSIVPALSVLAVVLVAGCSAGGSDANAGGRGNAAGGSASAAAGAGTNTGGTQPSGSGGGGSGNAGSVAIGGAGGMLASAGASGLSSSAGSAGAGGSAGSGSVGCASLPLCDDFEGVAAGAAPDPSKWIPTVLADCMTTAAAPTVDDSQHHSGTKSLKVVGTANFCDYAMIGNAAAFKAIGNVVYGRYYVRFETALPMGHTAFMIFPDQMSGHALRMGGQNMALQWNRQSDDATLPAQSPAGIAMSKVPPVGDWMCLEFMIDQAQGLISTWADGTLVAGLVADATPTADVDMQWGTTYRPNLTSFNIGWQNYGAGAMNLWFDDVALSATRIGCN